MGTILFVFHRRMDGRSQIFICSVTNYFSFVMAIQRYMSCVVRLAYYSSQLPLYSAKRFIVSTRIF